MTFNNCLLTNITSITYSYTNNLYAIMFSVIQNNLQAITKLQIIIPI